MAITKPSMIVDSTTWVLASDKPCYMQVMLGQVGIIFSDMQPLASIEVGDMGHLAGYGVSGDECENTAGGKTWVRATHFAQTATVSITEW